MAVSYEVHVRRDKKPRRWRVWYDGLQTERDTEVVRLKAIAEFGRYNVRVVTVRG